MGGPAAGAVMQTFICSIVWTMTAARTSTVSIQPHLSASRIGLRNTLLLGPPPRLSMPSLFLRCAAAATPRDGGRWAGAAAGAPRPTRGRARTGTGAATKPATPAASRRSAAPPSAWQTGARPTASLGRPASKSPLCQPSGAARRPLRSPTPRPSRSLAPFAERAPSPPSLPVPPPALPPRPGLCGRTGSRSPAALTASQTQPPHRASRAAPGGLPRSFGARTVRASLPRKARSAQQRRFCCRKTLALPPDSAGGKLRRSPSAEDSLRHPGQ